MGVCASSGGMFNNYAIVQGVDHIVPVDMYLPGCPPRPEMLIDAILKLHDKIQHEPLGPRRAKAARRPAARAGRLVGEVREVAMTDAELRSRQPGRRCPTSAGPPPPRRAPASCGAARSARTAPATPPASAAWSAGRTLPAPAERPYGEPFDDVADALVAAYPDFGDAVSSVVVDRGELTFHVAARPPGRAVPDAAGRPGAALRAVLVGVRRRLPRHPGPAALGLPPDLDDLPPAAAAGGVGLRRRPARARRSPASTRPPTGRSARRTTCSGSSTTATRR